MSDPTILWVHGYPLSSKVFEPQLAIAGASHVMPDLPGFGNAAPPEGAMSIDDYAHAVVRVMYDRGIERAILAGLSMGGYVCLAAARIAPERLSGLILIDTRETADSEEVRRGRLESIDKVRAEGTRSVVTSMLPKMLTAAAPAEMFRRVEDIMSSASREGVITALRAMAERPDSSSFLPMLRVPTLVVVGDHDLITPPADAERMARLIPNATLKVIANAAHLSNYEKPDEFNAAVEEWLGRTVKAEG